MMQKVSLNEFRILFEIQIQFDGMYRMLVSYLPRHSFLSTYLPPTYTLNC